MQRDPKPLITPEISEDVEKSIKETAERLVDIAIANPNIVSEMEFTHMSREDLLALEEGLLRKKYLAGTYSPDKTTVPFVTWDAQTKTWDSDGKETDWIDITKGIFVIRL